MSETLARGRTTLLPSAEDRELSETAMRAIAHAKREFLTVHLDGTALELPKGVTRLLSSILTETALGNSVTIIPVHGELTTQEAANLLNVSRPYLIKLLEKEDIPFHMSGTHRRIKFTDLTAYQNRFAEQRKAAQAELAVEAQEMGIGY